MTALDAARISLALGGHSYGRSLEVRARTGSTNDDVREAAAAGAPTGHVIVADAQDKGRGAHGRIWSSPGGTDLYFSILERRPLDPPRMPWLTLAVGLGLHDAVRRFASTQARAAIKWPNDLLLGDRKCAGILVESSSTGGQVGPFVIGVGLDVNRTSFAPELEAIATSMSSALGQVFDRNAVLAQALTSIEARIDELHAAGSAPLLRALRPHLAWVGERVSVDGTDGELLGVGDDGALSIRTTAGERWLRSGTLRRA